MRVFDFPLRLVLCICGPVQLMSVTGFGQSPCLHETARSYDPGGRIASVEVQNDCSREVTGLSCDVAWTLKTGKVIQEFSSDYWVGKGGSAIFKRMGREQAYGIPPKGRVPLRIAVPEGADLSSPENRIVPVAEILDNGRVVGDRERVSHLLEHRRNFHREFVAWESHVQSAVARKGSLEDLIESVTALDRSAAAGTHNQRVAATQVRSDLLRMLVQMREAVRNSRISEPEALQVFTDYIVSLGSGSLEVIKEQ